LNVIYQAEAKNKFQKITGNGKFQLKCENSRSRGAAVQH
jgi:translation initiation factor IF-1